MSFTPSDRLTMDSERSPSGPMSEMIPPRIRDPVNPIDSYGGSVESTAAVMTPKMTPPMNPSTVLLGDRVGASGRLPKPRPTK